MRMSINIHFYDNYLKFKLNSCDPIDLIDLNADKNILVCFCLFQINLKRTKQQGQNQKKPFSLLKKDFQQKRKTKENPIVYTLFATKKRSSKVIRWYGTQ